METKVCTRCHQELPVSEFYVRKDAPHSKYYSACKKCIMEREKLNPTRKERHQEYYRNNKEYFLEKAREYYKNNRPRTTEYKRTYAIKHRDEINHRHREKNKKVRLQFIEMYGGQCSCCGETTPEFLTIDHVQGQIGIKRTKKDTGKSAYVKAIKEFRPDLYQVLCWNCNCSKGRYGYCPHHE